MLLLAGVALAGTVERVNIEGRDIGKWYVTTTSTPGVRSSEMRATLEAEVEVKGWPDKSVKPVLMLECSRRKLYAKVKTVLRPDVAGNNYDDWLAIASIKLDEAPFQKVKMRRDITGDALFFPKTKEWMGKLANGDRLVFEFTPFASPAAQTWFDLHGTDNVLLPIYETCGKKPPTYKPEYDL